MRTFTPKLILAASLGLLLISGLQGDRPLSAETLGAPTLAGTDATQLRMMIDESQLTKKRSGKSEEAQPSFRFPNVFDALGLIF